MKTRADKSSYLPVLITGIAIIVFSTAGIARMMGWGPNSTDNSGDILMLDQTAPVPTTSEARTKPRCAECGVIVSMRKIERHAEDTGPRAAGEVTAENGDEIRVKTTRSYEITVRMADGSRHVIDDTSPARWRTGERLIVIGGVKPSKR
jgi:hypothetical protein